MASSVFSFPFTVFQGSCHERGLVGFFPTRAFNLATRPFSLLTRVFDLVTRGLNL